MLFYGLYSWKGWLGTWLVFYIEHLISNLNWILYIDAAAQLLIAAVKQNDISSWLSVLVYAPAAYWFFKVEYEQGTNAIRYIDPSYYSDPVLLPSLLYVFGIREHAIDTKIESDDSQSDDVIIDQFMSITY